MQGLDELVTKLNKLGGSVILASKKGVQHTLITMQGTAQELCPTDTGQTKASIYEEVKSSATEVEGILGVNTEQAPMAEFGTGIVGKENPHPKPDGWIYDINNHGEEGWVYNSSKDGKFYRTKGQPAKPFMYPAYHEHKNSVKNNIIEEMNKQIKELGG